MVCTQASPMLTLQWLPHSRSTFRPHHPKTPPSPQAAPRCPSPLDCRYRCERDEVAATEVAVGLHHRRRRQPAAAAVVGAGAARLLLVVAASGLQRHLQSASGWGATTWFLRRQCCSRSTLARSGPKPLPSWEAAPWVVPVAPADCWRPHGPATPLVVWGDHDGAVWQDPRRGPRDARRQHLLACCAWLVPGQDTPAARRRAMPRALPAAPAA